MAENPNTVPVDLQLTSDSNIPDLASRPLVYSLHRTPESNVTISSTHISGHWSESSGSEASNKLSAGPVTRAIDKFPDELLVCIFTHAPEKELCTGSPPFLLDTEWFRLMKFPVILSHVCSKWRQITIHSTVLWSCIYIHSELLSDSKSEALLEAYMTRSGQSLLEVCILDPHLPTHPDPGRRFANRSLEFLESIAPRAKSLILRSSRGIYKEGHPRSTLERCLDKCVPGVLKELVVEVPTYDGPEWQTPDTSLGLPRYKFEELWRSVSSLRLSGYYPYAIATSNWNSSQGLIEFRLNGWHPIPESTLISILAASPRLRILEVSTDIMGSLSKGPSIEPIYLESLEIVKSAVTNRPLTHQRQLRILLRLLQPGPKPLSLCISTPNQVSGEGFICQPEVLSFLGRTNVRQLCVYGLERRSHLVELLKIATSVRVLAIPSLKYIESDVDLLDDQPPLESIYVVPSFLTHQTQQFLTPSLDWPTVEWLVEIYQVRELTVWLQDFTYYYQTIGDLWGSRVPPNLYTVCPIVNAVDQGRTNPIKEWC